MACAQRLLPESDGPTSPIRRCPSLHDAPRPQCQAWRTTRVAEAISLFGSVARGEDTETSDIDFLVRFRSDASTFDLGALLWDLEETLGEKVDIVSDGKEFRNGNCRRILSEAIRL